MMYVEFLKNSYLTDSSELMTVKLISVSWAQKRLIPAFETWCTSSSWKILISPIRASWWLLESFRHPEPKNVWFPLSGHDVRRIHEKFSSLRFERAIGYKTRFDLLSPKTFDSSFLDMMYVELMKNSYLADSSELMAVRVISVSWAQKRLIPTFRDMMYVELMKNSYLADSSELMAVRVISASWAQKRLIPTFETWCTSSSWKFFFSPIRASCWLLDSFWPPEPKNVWFLLSRHDARRVHGKFLSRRFERADGC